MFKKLSIIAPALLLSACVTTPNLKPDETLAANEGILVTTCQTPNAVNRVVSVIREDYKHTFGDLPPHLTCSREGTLAAIKLEAGQYHVGNTTNFDAYKHLPKFTVKANKINYIGDLRIAVNETNVMVGLLAGFDKPTIRFSVVDERTETLQRLKAERPDISDNYSIVYDIAE